MAESDEQPAEPAPQGGAIPLAEAAARLGLSRDALRMRIRRGKARGFKRGGQVFVWLDHTAPEGAARAAAPEPAPDARRPAPRPTMRGAAEAGTAWPVLVEQQRQEIGRLIRETDRLNARLERHLEEAREMRLMLEREQVLRQQELALRRDVQALLERLVARPELAGTPLGTALAAPPETNPETNPASDPASKAHDPKPDLARMLKEIGQSLREAEAKEPPRQG